MQKTTKTLQDFIQSMPKAIVGIEAVLKEIEHLTAALHRVRAHPDYQYAIVPARDHTEDLLKQDGWEVNQEADTAPGDRCWRRRISS